MLKDVWEEIMDDKLVRAFIISIMACVTLILISVGFVWAILS